MRNICKREHIERAKSALRVCEYGRDLIRERVGHQLHHAEHVVYGVTYLLIGFTHLEGLYYAFGTFVLVTIVFGKES